MINRPIRTDIEYKAALAEIEKYFADEPKKGTAEADRFDLPTLLIEAYEEQHHPIGPPHPAEMIRHRMRTASYTQADLAALLGSRARASEVLTKKRRLTPAHDLEAQPGVEAPGGDLDHALCPIRQASSAAHGQDHKRQGGLGPSVYHPVAEAQIKVARAALR
jgi:HTH-type transcriptional regulator/antitoxin HigA